MKTTLRIIVLVLVAAFYGCQKNDVSLSADSSISSDGVLSGTIVNDSNRIDSIKMLYYNINIHSVDLIGKCAVSSNGKFSLLLTNPVLNKIGTYHSGVVVSDTTAMVQDLINPGAYKGDNLTGYIFKANYSSGDTYKTGQSDSQFMFSDRAFTIKGGYTQTDTLSTDLIGNIKVYTIKMNYNVIFKKGWNELVNKIDSYSNTSTTYTRVETYSNTVPSDLQWRYTHHIYPYNRFMISGQTKARGVHDIARQAFLFR